jgi:hypothetical protein
VASEVTELCRGQIFRTSDREEVRRAGNVIPGALGCGVAALVRDVVGAWGGQPDRVGPRWEFGRVKSYTKNCSGSHFAKSEIEMFVTSGGDTRKVPKMMTDDDVCRCMRDRSVELFP